MSNCEGRPDVARSARAFAAAPVSVIMAALAVQGKTTQQLHVDCKAADGTVDGVEKLSKLLVLLGTLLADGCAKEAELLCTMLCALRPTLPAAAASALATWPEILCDKDQGAKVRLQSSHCCLPSLWRCLPLKLAASHLGMHLQAQNARTLCQLPPK